MKEAVKEFEGSVALAESELVRYEDRLDWVKRMKKKGYVPAAQVTSEEANHGGALFSLSEEKVLTSSTPSGWRPAPCGASR